MYILDSNVIIDFLRGDQNIIKKVEDLKEYNEIFITPINLCELYKGIFLSSKTGEMEKLNNLLLSIDLLSFSEEICIEFGSEYARLVKMGKTPDEYDLMIASFARVLNLTIITENKKHFENFNIKLEVWQG